MRLPKRLYHVSVTSGEGGYNPTGGGTFTMLPHAEARARRAVADGRRAGRPTEAALYVADCEWTEIPYDPDGPRFA
jgi:hypothetical protein